MISLIVKGFIIGIAKVIPGVSGGIIAMSLGLYEKGIDSICNFFKDIKNNFYFLFSVGVGILLAIILGSKLILLFLKYNYYFTMFLFVGLIVGTTINICDIKKNIKKSLLMLLISLFVVLLYTYGINNSTSYVFSDTFVNRIYIIILGFIDAITMIIPGISGTAIFITLGVYEFILNLFSTIFSNVFLLILFGLGLFFGVIMISYFMNFMLKKYNDLTKKIICIFSISSIFMMILNISYNSMNLINFLISVFSFLIGIKLVKIIS